jgi:hypothetical protein
MTKHFRSIYRSSSPPVDLLTADAHQVTIPGCNYTWEQLAELRAALEEHLRNVEHLPNTDLDRTQSHMRTVYHDRTGQVELGYVEHHRLTISVYSLNHEQAGDFFRLLNSVLGGGPPACAPELPRIVPTPVCFHNLQKIPA